MRFVRLFGLRNVLAGAIQTTRLTLLILLLTSYRLALRFLISLRGKLISAKIFGGSGIQEASIKESPPPECPEGRKLLQFLRKTSARVFRRPPSPFFVLLVFGVQSSTKTFTIIKCWEFNLMKRVTKTVKPNQPLCLRQSGSVEF